MYDTLLMAAGENTGSFIFDISPKDTAGVPILYYSWFNDDKLTSIILGVAAVPTLMLAKFIATLGIYVVNLYSDPSMILGPVAWFIDTLLGQLFSIISLPVLMMLAITVFIGRQLLSVNAEQDSKNKNRTRWKAGFDPSGLFTNKASSHNGMYLGEGAYKELKDGFVHIVLSTIVLFFLLSNPMGLLAKITEFVQNVVQSVFANGTVGSGEDAASLGEFVANILAIFIATTNFSQYNTDKVCMDMWSEANADGSRAENADGERTNVGGTLGGVRDANLLSPDCFNNLENYLPIIGGILIVIAMLVIAAFFVVMASRAVLFLWNIVVIMYRLTLEILRSLFVPTPENTTLKSQVDRLVDGLWDFAVFLVYYILVLILTYVVPLGVISGFDYLGLNQVLSILLSTVVMGVAAFACWGLSPASGLLRGYASYQTSWSDIYQGAKNLSRGEIHRTNGDSTTVTKFRRDDGTFAVGEFVMASPFGQDIRDFKGDMAAMHEKTMRTITGDNYDKYQEEKKKFTDGAKRVLKIEDRRMKGSEFQKTLRENRISNLTARRTKAEEKLAELAGDNSPKAQKKREKLETQIEALTTKINATEESYNKISTAQALADAPSLQEVSKATSIYKEQYLAGLVKDNKALPADKQKSLADLKKQADEYVKAQEKGIKAVLEDKKQEVALYGGKTAGYLDTLYDFTQHQKDIEQATAKASAAKNSPTQKRAKATNDAAKKLTNPGAETDSGDTAEGAESKGGKSTAANANGKGTAQKKKPTTPEEKEKQQKKETEDAKKELADNGVDEETIKQLEAVGKFRLDSKDKIQKFQNAATDMASDEELKNHVAVFANELLATMQDMSVKNLDFMQRDYAKLMDTLPLLSDTTQRDQAVKDIASQLTRISIDSANAAGNQAIEKIHKQNADIFKSVEEAMKQNSSRDFTIFLEGKPDGQRAEITAAVERQEIHPDGGGATIAPSTQRALEPVTGANDTNMFDRKGQNNIESGYSNGVSQNKSLEGNNFVPTLFNAEQNTSPSTQASEIAATDLQADQYFEVYGKEIGKSK